MEFYGSLELYFDSSGWLDVYGTDISILMHGRLLSFTTLKNPLILNGYQTQRNHYYVY